MVPTRDRSSGGARRRRRARRDRRRPLGICLGASAAAAQVVVVERDPLPLATATSLCSRQLLALRCRSNGQLITEVIWQAGLSGPSWPSTDTLPSLLVVTRKLALRLGRRLESQVRQEVAATSVLVLLRLAMSGAMRRRCYATWSLWTRQWPGYRASWPVRR